MLLIRKFKYCRKEYIWMKNLFFLPNYSLPLEILAMISFFFLVCGHRFLFLSNNVFYICLKSFFNLILFLLSYYCFLLGVHCDIYKRSCIIYPSWICPLHHCPLSFLPRSWNSFNRSHFSILIHPPSPFP
jgi:hypothetical protein